MGGDGFQIADFRSHIFWGARAISVVTLRMKNEGETPSGRAGGTPATRGGLVEADIFQDELDVCVAVVGVDLGLVGYVEEFVVE